MKRTTPIQFTWTINHTPIKDSTKRIWMVKPATYQHQKISEWKTSRKPVQTYTDSQGNTILYFIIRANDTVPLTASGKIKILKNNDKYFVVPENKKRFLKNEQFLERPRWIRKLSQSLAQNTQNEVERARQFFYYTAKNFRYEYPVKKRGVANQNPKRLRGDCGEYTSVFVSLCRSIGIPARNITGFVLDQKKNTCHEHEWAEFYTKKYGWLLADPQYASFEKTFKKMDIYFGSLPDTRLSIVRGYNIPLRPRIPQKNNKKDLAERGYILTHSSVQTLQPYICISNSKKREIFTCDIN